MRGILISLGIIFLCLSVEALHSLDDAVYAESGKRFMPQRMQNPPLGMNSIPHLYPGNNGLNQTMTDMLNPVQQQSNVTEVMGFFGFMFGGIMFFVNVLFYSTAGFYWWAQQNLYVPGYLALLFSLLINLNHAIAIVQWVSSHSIEEGG